MQHAKLFEAVLAGRAGEVERLLQSGSPATATLHGASALGLAAGSGHASVAKLLLAAHANSLHREDDGATPLFIASHEAHTDVVRLILDNVKASTELNLDAPRTDGATALFIAISGAVRLHARALYHREIACLLLQARADATALSPEGKPLLHIACSGANANRELVRKILECQANPNQTNSRGGTTAMCIAATRGDVELVRMLCEANAAIDARAVDGTTALVCAWCAPVAPAVSGPFWCAATRSVVLLTSARTACAAALRRDWSAHHCCSSCRQMRMCAVRPARRRCTCRASIPRLRRSRSPVCCSHRAQRWRPLGRAASRHFT